MIKGKKPHSKQRIKFQEMFVDECVYSMSVTKLIDDFKAHSRTRLNRLSDEELIELIQDVTFENIYHIQQWEKYTEFVKYIKEK